MIRVRNTTSDRIDGIAAGAEGDADASSPHLASGAFVATGGGGKATLPPKSLSQANMPAVGANVGGAKPASGADVHASSDAHAAHDDQPRQPDGLFPPGQHPSDDNMGNDSRPKAPIKL